MTVTTVQLSQLAALYCQAVKDATGTQCEIMRNMAGAYVAVFAPIGRTVTLSTGDRTTAYATLTALLDIAEHTNDQKDATQ
tara:strand:+ start:82 stop:324 length:243 start_codon:yes stop_codon:yes gene_type:complete